MCDAIRAGEDTFECNDEDAYTWCTDASTLAVYLPAACELVVGAGYKNGVGKLKYRMDTERNILLYTTMYGSNQEFSYGDL